VVHSGGAHVTSCHPVRHCRLRQADHGEQRDRKRDRGAPYEIEPHGSKISRSSFFIAIACRSRNNVLLFPAHDLQRIARTLNIF
jgi:hypothetical protein